MRPGGLTDEDATGRIQTGTHFEGDKAVISRADVADTLAEALETPGSIGKTFEIIKGDTPIREAVEAL